ncbi:hypothetical protein CPB83DRAFT_850875 [Crepidotus variabilis]|uniref:F-box domain-containing protein n=1 Tax=Crepidotus variabilis TaxID=179855 RepID=A0A9P6EIP9_9AGAR|nr:hypothetical protein CPB83DRAFT_850875 [Crepidotus variabilis]
MYFGTLESANPAQILIDQQIAQFEKSIQQLKNQRNQNSSITRLPPEILGKIFAEAAYTETGEKLGKAPSPAERFNFSFVSQHWRSVAISTPEVWGILPDGYVEWCQIMLGRSKTTDLTVAINLLTPGSTRETFVKEVTSYHVHRLQELTIRFSSIATQRILDGFPASAPRLHILRLMFATFGSMDPGLTLPDHSFSDAHLSTLELKGCNLNWKSPLFTGLRSLKLTIGNTHATSRADFYEALKRMPGLEVLDIDNFNPSDSLVFDQSIPLCSLQQLCITSTSSSALNILQYLAVPVSVMVDLRCSAPLPTQTQTNAEAARSTLTSTISRFFSSMIGDNPGDAPQYHTIFVSRQSWFAIEAWRKPWIYSSPSVARTDKANFALRIYASDPFLAEILSTIPLSQIKTLSISTHLTQTFLMANFGNLPKLNTVVVNGGSPVITQLFKALTSKKNNKASYYRVVFPHLQHLIMYGAIFSEQDEVDYITVNSLRDCLMERSERGAPIQKLSILDCFDINKDEIQLLEELVVDVDWDGVEMEYEDEDDEEDLEEDSDYYSDEDDFDDEYNYIDYL